MDANNIHPGDSLFRVFTLATGILLCLQSLQSQSNILGYDVQARIDSIWGQGYPASEQLRLFDSVWTLIDQQYACFQNLDLDWNDVKLKYRPEIEQGVSRGRFGAIINHMGISLREPHTVFSDGLVSMQTKSAPGIPLFGGSHFGAALSPLPDSSLLVVQSIEGHPLGLTAGDVVLGYDGLRWSRMYRELFDLELPTTRTFVGGNEEVFTHLQLSSAGENWHHFDTVDIVKYSSGDTLHLPTTPLGSLDSLMQGGRSPGVQIPVPGVPFPDEIGGPTSSVSWGVVSGTAVGYVYVWSWFHNSSHTGFYDALDSLIRICSVSGLILDFRVNSGGYVSNSNHGLSLLFDGNPPPLFLAQRSDPFDHFAMRSTVSFGFFDDTTRSFDGPIAVLTGPLCISACDFVSLRMKSHPRSRVFGLTTASGYASPMITQLDSTLIVRFAFLNGFEDETAPRYLTHTEFPVDEKVWHTREAASNGEDAVVNAALTWIQSLTGFVAERPHEVPEGFTLEQNFPNPFNTSTTISYLLPLESHVVLTVVDLLGRDVRALVNEKQSAGRHTARFDARGLSSGVYFYSLRAGAFARTKKLLLLQ